jgi:hypothetical protein|tara:strand:+ start:1280 stop:3808 length:2529 start_codon:yes stop_codon:yes gene_type:complete
MAIFGTPLPEDLLQTNPVVIPEIKTPTRVDERIPINRPGLMISPNDAIMMGSDEEDRRKEGLENQELFSKFAGDFDPSTELNDNLLEFDLSKSKNLTAKQQKFKEIYPDGILTPLALENGDVKLFYKKKPTDPFRFVNRGVNVPEIVGALASGEVIGGAVGSALGLRFGGVQGSVIGTGTGTAIGSLAETGLEKLRGYETAGLQDEIEEATTEGLIATGVDLATRGLFRAYKKIKNRGNTKILDVEDYADDLARFAEKETLEPLVKGNVIKSELLQSSYSQTKITNPIALNKQRLQEASLLKKFGEMGSAFNPDLFTKRELALVLKSQSDDLVKTLFQSTDLEKPLARDFLEVGKDFVEGIKTWKIGSRTIRDDLYAEAFKQADDVVFDISPLQKIGTDIRKVVTGRGQLSKPEIVPTGLVDETGQAITRTTTPVETAVPLDKLPTEVLDVIKDLKSLNPQMTTYQGFNPIEQLKTLRTRVFNLQQSEDAATKLYANKLYNGIIEVMHNPVSGNKQFLNAYQKASNWNKYREEVLNLSVIKKSLKSDTIEDIIQSKFNITQPSEVSYIKKIFADQPDTFKMLKNSYLTDIVNDPATLNKFMKKQDLYEDVVKEIFKPDEVKAIQEFAASKSLLNTSKLKSVIENDVSNYERALVLINEGYDSFAKTLQSQGGKKSAYGQSLKAGAFKNILDNATETSAKVGGINKLNLTKLKKGLNELNNNKALTELLFTKEELLRLDNFNLYASTIDVASDVGGQMQKGAAGASVKDINPATKISVGKLYLSNSLTARILTAPFKAGSKVSGITEDVTPNLLRYLTVGISNVNNNLKKERLTDDPRLDSLN